MDFLVQLKKTDDESEKEDPGMMYEAKTMKLVLLEEKKLESRLEQAPTELSEEGQPQELEQPAISYANVVITSYSFDCKSEDHEGTPDSSTSSPSTHLEDDDEATEMLMLKLPTTLNLDKMRLSIEKPPSSSLRCSQSI